MSLQFDQCPLVLIARFVLTRSSHYDIEQQECLALLCWTLIRLRTSPTLLWPVWIERYAALFVKISFKRLSCLQAVLIPFAQECVCPCCNYLDRLLKQLLFKCLRDHLSLPGQDSCPSCSVKASDSHIKRVPAIEEVVTRWKEARPALLDLLALQIAQSTASTSKVPNDKVNGKKRKLDSPVVESSKKKGKSRAVESDSDIEEIVDPTNRTYV